MALDTIPKQEGGKLKAVASGTLPSGQPVVVNSDGTVSVVAATSVDNSFGTAAVFESASTNESAAVYDSASNKVVISYRDAGNSSRGTAVVGTVSGDTISFGTPVVFSTRVVEYSFLTYDSSNNRVVMAYADSQGSRYGYAIVGTVSGTSISFGTETVFNSFEVQEVNIAYDAGAQKVVIVYEDWGNSNQGTAIVGTVSGTSISFGTEVVFDTFRCRFMSATYDAAAQKVVIAYIRENASGHGYAVVGTVSGTSVSFGSPAAFNSAGTSHLFATYDAGAQKIVIAYSNNGNSSYGTAIVGTVSGTSISFGTAVVFESATATQVSATYDANAQKVVVIYRDDGNLGYGTAITGTVSGTSISFDSPAVFESASTTNTGVTYDANAQKVVIAYTDAGNLSYGTSVVFQPAFTSTNLTAENYIGMSGGVVDATNTSFGSSSTFESATVSHVSSAYDTTNDKIVIAYRDSGNSNYGTAVVGTVSGTSVSFGTPVVYNSGDTRYTSTLFDPVNEKIVISYIDWGNNERPTSIVGTVSGTSISFGSEVVMSAVVGSYMTTAFDTNASKFVASFRDDSNSGYGRAFVGTVSGTSVSFGSAGTYNTATTNTPTMVFDSSNNKIVITYVDAGNSDTLTSVVGTVSGTSISFGSEVALPTSGSAANPVSVFDTNSNKVVVLYTESGTSYAPQAIVGTVSGTSISFSTKVEAGNGNDYIDFTSMCFDPDTNQVVIVYEAVTTDALSVKTATVSGNSITFSDPTVVATGPSYSFSVAYDVDTDQVVIPFVDGNDNNYGKGIVGSIGSTTRYPVADGDNATIDIVGTVSSNQVDLTAGQKYYVQTDGTLSETPDDPSVLAGTAVSATKMVVKS